MAFLRRNMRAFAATWLVFQVAWLLALVPRDCCAAHRPATPARTCHESTAASYCPMRAADGTPCPMHRAPAEDAVHAEHDRKPAGCRVSGACDGPMAALFALLSNHGILPDSASVMPDRDVRSATVGVDVNLLGRFETPDPPPPRA